MRFNATFFNLKFHLSLLRSIERKIFAVSPWARWRHEKDQALQSDMIIVNCAAAILNQGNFRNDQTMDKKNAPKDDSQGRPGRGLRATVL